MPRNIVFVVALLCSIASLDLVSGRMHRARENIRRQTDTVAYTPMQPSALSEYEVRTGGAHSAPGDYVMQGLGQTMSLATQAYGLRDSESFYWGIDGNPMANLTAYAEGEEVRVLSMERFSSVIQTAECSPNSVKLKFNEEVQFDEVQKAWQWVNDAEDHYIVLVTESAKCNVADGDDTIRQPWHVKNIVFDDNSNVITLSAESKTWEEAFTNWHLRVDSRGLIEPQQPKRQSKRDDNGLLHKDNRVSLEKPWPNNPITLKAKDQDVSATASVSCIGCGTRGSMHYILDASPALFQDPPWKGYFKFMPEGLEADISLKTAVSAVDKGFVGEVELFRIQLPGPRIYIPKLVDIGPELKYIVQGNIGRVEAGGEVTTGGKMTISDQSVYYVDLHTGQDGSVGWQPDFAPLDTEVSGHISVSGTLSGQLRLDLHGEILGKQDAELGVLLAAPEFKINATTSAKSDGGACANEDAEFAAEVVAQVGVHVDAYASVDLGKWQEATAKTIYSTAWPLYSTCVPIDDNALPTLSGTVGGQFTKDRPSPTDVGTLITGADISQTTFTPTVTATPTPGIPGTFGTDTCAQTQHGSLLCNGPTLFGLCNWGSVIWQRVAFGTACQDNAIIGTGIYSISTAVSTSMYAPAPTGGSIPTCEVHGALVCNGEKQFGLCNWGKVTWQDVADGTICQDDRIVGMGIYAGPVVTAVARRW